MVDAHPGVVFIDITRFGRVGPYADYRAGDLVALALSGYLFMCGLNDREPLRLGVDLVDHRHGRERRRRRDGGTAPRPADRPGTGGGGLDASHDAVLGDELPDQLLVPGHGPAPFVEPRW